VSVDSRLVGLLRCPVEHHASLTYDDSEQTLTCTDCRRVYEIRDGIPALVVEEARVDSGPGAGA
jgi:uncharacterized protein